MRVPVWVGSLGKDDLVGKITHETGGEIIDAGSTGSLDSALATVINRLKLRYTLGYNSPNPAKDGSFRKIDVRLTERYGRPDSDYSVSARRGYYSQIREGCPSQSVTFRHVTSQVPAFVARSGVRRIDDLSQCASIPTNSSVTVASLQSQENLTLCCAIRVHSASSSSTLAIQPVHLHSRYSFTPTRSFSRRV